MDKQSHEEPEKVIQYVGKGKQESPAVADKPVRCLRSLHGLRKSSGVVSCIASLPIDSVPMVSYIVTVSKMHRFGDTRLLKLPWPWNVGEGSLKVIKSDTIR